MSNCTVQPADSMAFFVQTKARHKEYIKFLVMRKLTDGSRVLYPPAYSHDYEFQKMVTELTKRVSSASFSENGTVCYQYDAALVDDQAHRYAVEDLTDLHNLVTSLSRDKMDVEKVQYRYPLTTISGLVFELCVEVRITARWCSMGHARARFKFPFTIEIEGKFVSLYMLNSFINKALKMRQQQEYSLNEETPESLSYQT